MIDVTARLSSEHAGVERDEVARDEVRRAAGSNADPGAHPQHQASVDVPLVPPKGSFEGQVAILGRTRVEGCVRGSLRGPGELVLGPEARIEGIIEVDAVSSRGTILGPVVARIRARFGDGARFEGDLDAPRVEVDGDVVWNGVARVSG